MYQYKGYTIVLGKNGLDVFVYKPDGTKLDRTFATDKEAEEFIDDLVE